MLYGVCWTGLAVGSWIFIAILIQEIIHARHAPRKRIKNLREVSYHGPCRECRGTGICHWCYGEGKVKSFLRRREIVCPYCGGSGLCPHCSVKGKVMPSDREKSGHGEGV